MCGKPAGRLADAGNAHRSRGGRREIRSTDRGRPRHHGQPGQRPVGDIDVLILGEPDRDQLYAALSTAEDRLARPVQATIRDPAWLESGSGAFHDTITSRPLLRLSLPDD